MGCRQDIRRAVVIALFATVLGVGVVAARDTTSPAVARAAIDSGCSGVSNAFGGDARPSACWRPYADASPFNSPLPARPKLARNSKAIVRRLMGFGRLQNLVAGDAGTTRDYGRPTYWARPTDPRFTIHCTEDWGTCPVEGMTIPIPDAARVPGGTDGHMTVMDPASGWEYDFWRVQPKPAGGGRLVVAWGGRTAIDGDGLGSAAVAANFGTAAGLLRAEELQAGEIRHALVISVRCDSGKHVFPADHNGASCASLGKSNAGAPPMGARFQLAMTDAQIRALGLPQWRIAILRALARYGMYVVDTGGSWGFIQESGLVYTSFGQPDRWVDVAREVGADYWEPDQRYALHIREGVDWKRYLRVIDPCETRGTC